MEDITEFIYTTPLPVQMAILFGVALLVSTIATLVIFAIIRQTVNWTDNFTLDRLAKRARNAFFWFLTLALTVTFWSGLEEVDAEGVRLDPWYLHVSIALARTVLYISGGLLLIRLVSVGADTVRHRYGVDDAVNFQERKVLTQLQYIERIIGIVVFIITAAFILLQFDAVRSIGTGLLTSAGVGGIIIGFAAQKSIANLLAGFQIAFTQPIRINDALIVNGEFGIVEEITLTYVTLRIWDLRRMIVPLNKFIDESFQNWTRSTTQLIGSVFMYVDYTFPVAALREEAKRFVEAQELWDKEVFGVAVTDNNADVMTIRIICSGATSGNTFNLRCAVREHLIAWIQEHYAEHLPKTRLEMSPSPTSEAPTPGSAELVPQQGERE
jgi:small-conductance mechanosensitive channel